MPTLHYIPLVVQMLPYYPGRKQFVTEIQVRLCVIKENSVFPSFRRQKSNNKAAIPQDQRAGNWLQVVAVVVAVVGKGEQHPLDEDTYPIL